MPTVQVGNQNVTYDPAAVVAAGQARNNTRGDVQGALSALESGSLQNAGRAAGYIQDIISRGTGYQGGRDIRSAALAYLQAAGGAFTFGNVSSPLPPTTATDPLDDIIGDLSRPVGGSTSTGNDEVDTTQGDDNPLYSRDSPAAIFADLFRTVFGSDNDTLSPQTEYVPIDTFGTGGSPAPARSNTGIIIVLLLAAAGAAYYYFVYRKGGQ